MTEGTRPARPTRPVIVAANWKMNTTPLDASLLANEIADATDVPGVTRVICPPVVCLESVSRALEDTDVLQRLLNDLVARLDEVVAALQLVAGRADEPAGSQDL